MPTSAVLLVLVSTVLHAGWNARLHRTADPEVVIALSYLAVGIVLLPAAVMDPPIEVIGAVLASAVAHSAYLSLLGTGYREGSLSVVYPIARGTAPLLVGLGGWLLLDERPSVPMQTEAPASSSLSHGWFVCEKKACVLGQKTVAMLGWSARNSISSSAR